MRKPIVTSAITGLVFALAACGGQSDGDRSAAGEGSSATGPAAQSAAADNAPAAFNQCRSCHSVEPDKHLIGPSLAGIYGTPAGDIEGYAFSPAMKESGIVWDEAKLDAYIKAPREVVPGTKMTYPGLKNDAQRAEVVAYLKSLSGEGVTAAAQ